MKIAIAQIAPVLLNRKRTLEKVVAYIKKATDFKAELICFGEALVPGYPVWLDRADGARFNHPENKTIHAKYLQEAVNPEAGDLDEVLTTAHNCNITVVLGIIERAADRGGHSLYCSLVVITNQGKINHIHRKLMPTYEERLAWAIGDGAGLQSLEIKPFTLTALNCWENWMPLARSACYALGTNLHIALWPGSVRNTRDITRFIAMESRAYVVSASAILRGSDISDDIPNHNLIVPDSAELIHDGGSCIAAPIGDWLLEPQTGSEDIYIADLDYELVLQERQNFDPAGHYARPDVLQLTINRQRQSTIRMID